MAFEICRPCGGKGCFGDIAGAATKCPTCDGAGQLDPEAKAKAKAKDAEAQLVMVSVEVDPARR